MSALIRLLARWAVIMAALLVVSGCHSRVQPPPDDRVRRGAAVDADSVRRVVADSIISALSPRQRAAMLLMPAIYSRTDSATMSLLRRYAVGERVGGIILLKGDTAAVKAISDTLRKLGRRDMLIAIDAEWGLGMRLSDAPVYPRNSRIGAVATDSAMYDYGRQIGRQCRSLGINMVLGPVADVAPDSVHTFMSERALGSDPEKVAGQICAYSLGVLAEGVMPVAKHFPGHGSLYADSHKELPVLTKSLYQLEHSDLVPFRRYVEKGLPAVMIGHIAVPAVDPQKRSAAVSRTIITDLLRGDLKFKGLILTDALNMGGAGGASVADAVAAGADLVLAPLSTVGGIDTLMKAVEEGVITQAAIDSHCRNVLVHLLRLSDGVGDTRSRQPC